MWVDEGTILDFAAGSGSWHSEGYDTGKHVFETSEGFMKIRRQGIDSNWAFSDNAKPITNYLLEDHSGPCQHGAENHPNSCAKKVLLDFSLNLKVPRITGMWDVESAGN